MVEMLSKWCNLNSGLGYHTTPPSPIFWLPCTWFLLLPFSCCPVSASWLLSWDSPHTCASPVITCFDLAPPLDWPWALGCSTWPMPFLGSYFLLTLGLWPFALHLAPWGSWLFLSAQPSLGSCSSWGWPWCSFSSSFSHQPLFIPAHLTSPCFSQPSVWAGIRWTLKILVINLEGGRKMS